MATLVTGVLLVVGAGLWRGVAAPALVKFPLDTNTTLHYRGHFVTLLDSSTGTALAQPMSAPLLLDRRIRAVPSQSSGSVAIIHEDITLHVSGRAVAEHNVYAVDRSSMCNVASHLACTFAPGNPAATTGSYYVTLPMNIQPGETPLRIWKPETGTTYPLKALPAAQRYSTVDGLRVAWFSGKLPMTPVAPYERRALAARGLPMTMSPAQVETRLSDLGVSVPALIATLAPVLSPAETAKVAAVLGRPVTLRYSAYGSGLVAAETRTGTIIELKDVVDGIAVAPDTTGLRTVLGVLQAHQSVPGVPAAVSALEELASAPPQEVYELRYGQTPASVSTVVATAKSQLGQVTLVEDVIPALAGVLGLVLITLGLVFLRRRPPASIAPADEVPAGTAPARESAGAPEQPGQDWGAA